MSAESRILCRVEGSTERFRIVCFHPSCSLDHLLQKVATTLKVVPPIGTLLLAADAEEEDSPAIGSMKELREGDRCIFVPSNDTKKESPQIIDVDEIIDIDDGPPLAPIIVKSEVIYQGSSEAVDSVEPAGDNPSPEIIDVDIEPTLAPIVVKSSYRSHRSSVEAGDKAIQHKVKSEETLPSGAKMEDSSEPEESKEEKFKTESTSGSDGSSQTPPKLGSRFFYRHGGILYPVIIFKYQHSHRGDDKDGREMKTETCYIRYVGIKGKAWEGYRLPILVKLSELLVHTEQRERKYKRRMRLQMAARNHISIEKGKAEEYANGADKLAVEEDSGQSCTQAGEKSKDKASIGVGKKDHRKSRKQARSTIEESVPTEDGSGEEEPEKHTKQTFEVRSEIQRATREAQRTSDRRSCARTDATQKKKRRVESPAGASEERSSNEELPKLGTTLFYNVDRDLYPVVVCEEPNKKAKQRRPQEGECYVKHTGPIGRLGWFGQKRLICVKADKLVAYTEEREVIYNRRMLQSNKQGLEYRNSLVKPTGVQADRQRARAYQEAEKRVAITARQVELAEKNTQLRMERLCERRQTEQEKESRKRQRMEEGKRREEELDRQYGPPTDVSCLCELYEDDQVEGLILEEPAKNRFVYFAFDNDTAEMIAKKFEISVAKIIYDNTKSTKLFSLTKVRRLLAFTPIVIPMRWGGAIYKNPSRVKHKAITKQERTSLVEDVVVAVTPGYEKLLPPRVLQQANIVSPTQEERHTHGHHVRPEVEMMYG
jgi:hypothetical protein